MKFKNIIDEIKNRHYVKDKLIIIENLDNQWGYKIFNKHGRLVKAGHSSFYTKETALSIAESMLLNE